LAETINGLYKAEVIHRRGTWRSFEAVEYATLEWATGSITADCSNPSATSHPQKQRNATMPSSTHQLSLHNLNQTASGKPGAVHLQHRKLAA
jgi:hypothetical protein